jgi:hypothetical protein
VLEDLVVRADALAESEASRSDDRVDRTHLRVVGARQVVTFQATGASEKVSSSRFWALRYS